MTKDSRKAAASLKAFFGDGPAKDLSPALRAQMERLRAAAERPSNVDDGPLAGTWLYRDFPGAEAVRVEIHCGDDGERIVHFPAMDGDSGAEVMLTDMAAYGPHWRAHFTKPA